MPGFLRVGAEPLREAFLMVHDAADWCSLETTCRGFTISAEVHNDRLLWVRFSADSSVVVSSEWMSYLKEPAAAHAYTFSPGFFVSADGAPPLHAAWTTMPDAHAYCDAEPRCSGFSLAKSTPEIMVSFAGPGTLREVYVDSQVAYGKGPQLLPPSSGAAAAPIFEMQLGFVGGMATRELHSRRLAEQRRSLPHSQPPNAEHRPPVGATCAHRAKASPYMRPCRTR